MVAHPCMVLGGHGHGHGQGQAGVWCVPWKKKMRCGFWNITSGWPGSVYKRTNLTFFKKNKLLKYLKFYKIKFKIFKACRFKVFMG